MKPIEITRKQALKGLANELAEIKRTGKTYYRITTVKLPIEMDSKEFSFARNRLHLTQKQIAETLQLSIKSIQGYEQGINPIPGLVAKTLRLINSDKEFYAKMKSQTISAPKEKSPIRTIIKHLEKDIEYLRKIAA